MIIGVLVATISLTIANFGNRYSVLANFVRQPHDEMVNRDVCQMKPSGFFCKPMSKGSIEANPFHLVIHGFGFCAILDGDDNDLP